VGGELRVLLAVVLQQESVEVVEVVMVPDIGEVRGGADTVDLQEVLVVFIVGLVGVGQKAIPDAPLVQEEVLL
jgi:hypothetical protein